MAANTENAGRRVGRPRGPAPDPAERRTALLDAAERAIRTRGPDVGMDDIAAEIGLTKPAVYRSLGDKPSLTAALAERVTGRLTGQLAAALDRSADPDDPAQIRHQVSSAIDVFCRFVDENTNLYRFIAHGSVGTRHSGLRDRSLTVSLGELIRENLARDAERAGIDPSLADTWAYAILGAVFVATEHWLRDRSTSRAELVARLTALLSPALEQGPAGLAEWVRPKAPATGRTDAASP